MEKKLLRGFRDIHGAELKKIVRVEEVCKQVADKMGVEEIRLPILESADLYKRAVGEDSDIVSKEFYSFVDKGDRSICLRPEGTAGCMRAYMEGNFRHSNGFIPKKFWYQGSMFRYERPQKGRYREFSQFGVEFFNVGGVSVGNLIDISDKIFKELGLKDKLELHINNLGSSEDRAIYKKKLLDYLEKYKADFSEEEWSKILKNPLRIWDSKDEKVEEILENAPMISDIVSSNGDMIGWSDKLLCKIDPKLVRGLDYYNGMVFEWKIKGTGKSQNTVCGGGQYDGLARHLGYQSVNAVGFALGIERVAELLEDDTTKEENVKIENKSEK